MGHHGNFPYEQENSDEFRRMLNGMGIDQLKSNELELGATGKFPMGKIHPNDEGEIRMGITNDKGKVVIDFGTKVQWIGFSPEQARLVAQSLINKADEAEFKKG